MKKCLPLLLFFFALSGNTWAQALTINIFGSLQSASKAPIADASISLLKGVDNSFVSGNTSKDDGTFSIDNVAEGNYKIKITLLGFKEYISEAIVVKAGAADLNLGSITLRQRERSLKEVAIVKEKNMLEMSIDKKTFNVDKNITATGGTAADVLQNIPSVTVDATGNVSLRGKSNVTILIDGRPATLLAGDVASALQALPAASIDNVEIITNPSSKYDAQGKTGIINIITKANKNQGLNGMFTLGAGTRDKYNGGLNINLRKNKWNYALNSNFRISNNYQRNTTERNNRDNDSGSYTAADGLRQFDGSFNSITVGYSPDSLNTLSLTQNVNFMRFGNKGYQEFDLLSAPGILYNTQRRDEIFRGGPNSGSTNMNWKHKFKKPKQELVTDASFSYSQTDINQNLRTYDLDTKGIPASGVTVQDVPSANTNRNFNIQTDFSSPIGKKEAKIEAGLKSQNFWFDSKNNATITLPGGTTNTDFVLKNEYKYDQHTHAAYTNYTNKYKKWSYQGGLRLEYAAYNGYGGATVLTNYNNSFLNLFPTAYLAYQLKETQQVYLNYSRRTDRPYFRQLLPYLNISNALDTTSGNPNLEPEFIDNIEIAYNLQLPKGNNIMASVYFQNTNNLSQNYTKTYADGTSFSQNVNLSSGRTFGLELIGKSQITKAWDATLSTNFFQNKIDGSNVDPSINNEGFSWFAKLNSNYKFSKQLSLQFMGNYESAKPAAQGRLQEVYWMDLALKGTFLKGNKASLTLNVTDIFNTRKYTTNFNLPLYEQSIYRDRETRIATLTFTYKFGKTEFNQSMGGGRGRRGKGTEQKKELQTRDGNLKSGGGEDDNNGGGGGQK
jgi:iron complex outermembrane recepter protein